MDEKRQVSKRMTRMYYHLKPSGAVCFQTLLSGYARLANGIRNILDHKE